MIIVTTLLIIFFISFSVFRIVTQASTLKEGYQEKLKLQRDELFVLSSDQKSERIKWTASKIASDFIEKHLLLKTDVFGYWNNVNMNLRLIGCFLVSFQITLALQALYFLFTNGDKHFSTIEALTILGTTFAAIFFNERTSYYQKWSYLANLYNERIKACPENLLPKDESFSYRRMLEVSLAIDVIQMEMWSHDSFAVFTRSQLFEAMKFQDKNLNGVPVLALLTESNKLNKATAIKYLGDLQLDLLEKYRNTNSRYSPQIRKSSGN